MIDFLGAYPMRREKDIRSFNPFRLWKEASGMDLPVRAEDNGEMKLWMLAPEDGDYCQENGRAMLLLGECYPRSGYSAYSGTGKLSAEEVLRHWIKRGRQMIPELKGSFVALVQEPGAEGITLFNDPLGLKPLYYGNAGTGWGFATSLHALKEYFNQAGKDLDPDPRGLADHYLFDFILDESTYLKGIRELPPGSILTLTGSRCQIESHFDPFRRFDLSGPRLSRKDSVARLTESLRREVSLRSEGPGQTAVALTGGFDSRSILAVLGESARNYHFFSYGKAESWDIHIARRIADEIGLQYQSIILNNGYRKVFDKYAKMAVMLSEGRAEFTHANIAYAYDRHLRDKRSLLTGLFGSELIKSPTSRGLYIDHNTLALLQAEDPVQALQGILRREKEENGIVFEKEVEAVLAERVASHPFLNNDLPAPKKLFHYLLRVGVRQYFRKELSIQRSWKANLSPYLDIDFIDALLETPFPWVYHYTRKKSLVRNLSIHRVYAEVINQDPRLSKVISTHGYRPHNLLHPLRLPRLAAEFYTHKEKSRKDSGLGFQREYARKLVHTHLPETWPGLRNPPAWKQEEGPFTPEKNQIKMASIHYWMKTAGLSGTSESRQANLHVTTPDHQ